MNRISTVTSETSSVASSTPVHVVRNFRTVPNSPAWNNSDHPLAPRARPIVSAPPAARLQVVQSRPVIAPPPPPAVPVEPPREKPSVWRRVGAIAGVLLASVGTVAGLVSIAALGVVGLGVAAGAFFLGCMLIRAGTRNQ